jgi:hypothetical protein
MGVLKTVGVIGAISGIGLIGYYYLNKKKPTIAKEQKAELQGQLYVLKNDKPEYRKIWSILAKYGYDNISKGSPDRDYLPLINRLLTQNPLVISSWENSILTDALRNIQAKNPPSTGFSVFYSLIGKDLEKWLQNAQNGGWDGLYFQKKSSENIVQETFTSLYQKDGIKCGIDPITKKDLCAFNYGIPFNKAFSGMPDDSYWNRNGGKDRWIFDNYLKYAISDHQSFFRGAPNITGVGINILADDCVELDRAIKRIIDKIAEQTRTAPDEKRRRVLSWYKDILEDYSEFQACRDKIEQQRALDLAKQVTVSSITAEASVLGENQKSQDIYLGIGAIVLVLSTAILLSGAGSKSSTPSSGSSTSTSGSSKLSGILSSLVIVGGLSGMGYLIFKKPKQDKSSDELTNLLAK